MEFKTYQTLVDEVLTKFEDLQYRNQFKEVQRRHPEKMLLTIIHIHI